MVAFTELTPDDQGQVVTYLAIFRNNVSSLAAALSRMSQMDQLWQGSVSASITSLDALSIVPDNVGLANGAKSLTREELLGLMTAIESVLTNFNAPANRVNFVKVGGMINTF